MRFVTLETGCFVCLTHLPNKDGYLRKAWGNPRKGGSERHMEMFHRFVYRAHKGEIPEGHEVDHTCRVRLCCNPEHLQALPGKAHAIKGNATRYRARYEQAHAYWRVNRPTGVALAAKFGVSGASGALWIKQWKALEAAKGTPPK